MDKSQSTLSIDEGDKQLTAKSSYEVKTYLICKRMMTLLLIFCFASLSTAAICPGTLNVDFSLEYINSPSNYVILGDFMFISDDY